MFTTIVNIISLMANICILVITAYTLYITVLSTKLKFVSIGFSGSAFFGEQIIVQIENRALHAIPASELFLLKRTDDGVFHTISLAKYDSPIAIQARHIEKIACEPFTEIDGIGSLVDIHMNSVIGVNTGSGVLWIKPYKKAPLKAARKAYKKHRYTPLTVMRCSYGDKVLSKGVRYAVHLKTTDANGRIEWKNAFAFRSGIISDAICGYNAVSETVCGSAHDLQKHLQDSFGIPDTDIFVEEIKGFTANEAADTDSLGGNIPKKSRGMA